jgi:hypothetical protein
MSAPINFPKDGFFVNDDEIFQRNSYKADIQLSSQSYDFDYQEQLGMYTHEFDTAINSCLRKNLLTPKTKFLAESINLAVAKTKLLPPLMLYRGVSSWGAYEVGTSFVDLGYSSKTISLQTAFGFADSSCCILFMGYLEPSKHIFMIPYSKYRGEDEVLTFPGERFEIVEEGTVTLSKTTKKAYYCRYIDNIYGNIHPDLSTIKVVDKVETFFKETVMKILATYPNEVIKFTGKGYNGKELSYVFSKNPKFRYYDFSTMDITLGDIQGEDKYSYDNMLLSMEARLNTLDITDVFIIEVDELLTELNETWDQLMADMRPKYDKIEFGHLSSDGIYFDKSIDILRSLDLEEDFGYVINEVLDGDIVYVELSGRTGRSRIQYKTPLLVARFNF